MSASRFSVHGGDDLVDQRVEVGVGQTPAAEERAQRAERADARSAEDPGVDPCPSKSRNSVCTGRSRVQPRPVGLDGDVVARRRRRTTPTKCQPASSATCSATALPPPGSGDCRRVDERGVLGRAHHLGAGRVVAARSASAAPVDRRAEHVALAQLARRRSRRRPGAGGDRHVVRALAAGPVAAAGVERVVQEGREAGDGDVVRAVGGHARTSAGCRGCRRRR